VLTAEMDGLGVAGIILTTLVSAAALLVAYFNSATRMVKRVDELTSRVFTITDEHNQCRVDLANAMARIRALESATGLVPTGALGGIIIADLHGIVKEFSPSLTPIFKFTPPEVAGKHITTIVPDDMQPGDVPVFADALRNPSNIDSGKTVLAYGRTKIGERVPITITLNGWKVGHEGLITATIRQRPQTVVST
jgi:PAS domain S-box-containing protein